MNSDLSVNILTNVLSLLNHISQLDDVTKCPVHEFSLVWQRLRTLVAQYTDSSFVSSLAVLTLAVLISQGPQSDISQLVHCCSKYYILLLIIFVA